MSTWLKSCQASKSTAPAVLPCDKYQCNKSLLVIQEATKNDRAAIPKKLIEYMLQLLLSETSDEHDNPVGADVAAKKEGEKADKEKPKVQSWCTAREQSNWIITQLNDIFKTKQRWSMIKVNFVVHILLWKGSRVFIEEFHRRMENKELSFFDFQMVVSWRQVPQTNPTGAELPSVFDKDKRTSEGSTALGSGGENSGGEDKRCKGGCEDVRVAFHDAWEQATSRTIGDYDGAGDLSFTQDVEGYITNYMAYLESLAKYRYDYPQVDLLKVLFHDRNVSGDATETQQMRGDELQGLIMATVELIKSTVANTSGAPSCAMSTMIILFHCVNAHILYKIGSRMVTGFLHILVDRFLEVLRAVDKDGLDGSGSVVIASLPSVPNGSDMFKAQHITGDQFSVLAPRQKLAYLAREWYMTFYQFNRSADLLRGQYEQIQEVMKMPVTSSWLHVLPRESFEMMKTYGSLHPSRNVCAWCGSEADTPACHPEGEHRVPPCAVHLVSAWRQQVKNVRILFTQNREVRRAPKVIDELERSLAEAEKDFMSLFASNSSTGMTHGAHSSNSGTMTGTFVIRRKNTDGSFSSSSSERKDMDVEVMYLDQLMGKTTDSIEALLQQDDVVVVCPDDFSATDRLKLADRFVVLKERPLGEGSYGKVYRAWDELLGSYLAAKEVPLDSSKGTAAAVHEALHEYTILTQLHHPHIVAVRAFMVTGSVGTIFMEWMPSGSLQEVLRSNPRGCLREPVVARFMRDALRGLEYLHSRDIMHRDVKPANMLLGTDGSVKLTDFGNSFVMAEGRHTIENSTITGTAPYIAPECAQGTYSPAGDVWSLGCTAVELLSGLVPWSDPVTGSRPETIPLIFRIGMLDDKTRTDRPHTLMWDNMVKKAGKEGLSPELRSFLDAIFVVDRHARPTATQLLQHPFILEHCTPSVQA